MSQASCQTAPPRGILAVPFRNPISNTFRVVAPHDYQNRSPTSTQRQCSYFLYTYSFPFGARVPFSSNHSSFQCMPSHHSNAEHTPHTYSLQTRSMRARLRRVNCQLVRLCGGTAPPRGNMNTATVSLIIQESLSNVNQWACQDSSSHPTGRPSG